MLTPEDLYLKLLLKVNKNDTKTNVKIPKGVFVIIFNEQKNKYLDFNLYKNESSDLIEGFDELLKVDEELLLSKRFKNRDEFALPSDFYKRVGAYAISSKESCKGNVLVIWFKKPKDINVLLQNNNFNPSFEYQETLGLLNDNKVSVYKDKFKIDNVFLTYYRNPPDLDVKGYVKEDGSVSKNSSTGLSDINLEKILDLVVIEIDGNYQDIEKLNVSVQRRALNERT